MHIGVPTEIKPHETRTAVTPTLAATLTSHGHEVIVQRGAGAKSDLSDSEYQAAGATLVGSAEEVWARGDLIVKVKEPIAPEFALFRPDQAIFCFLHLAAARECQDALIGSGCTAIAFETVELADGRLPLLAPMSAVAGRLACQFGAHFLTAPQGGRGLLLGGIEGAHPANTVVIGAGTAGYHAASVAVGLQADVTMIDRNPARLEQVTKAWSGRVRTVLASDEPAMHDLFAAADLIVCAALVPGARAPVVVTDSDVSRMAPGSVLVDVAIDQGGNYELARPTTHGEPTYDSHGVLVSCITNLPAAVPRTSTFALGSAISEYVIALADKGWKDACAQDPALALGINVTGGRVVHPALLP